MARSVPLKTLKHPQKKRSTILQMTGKKKKPSLVDKRKGEMRTPNNENELEKRSVSKIHPSGEAGRKGDWKKLRLYPGILKERGRFSKS